MTYQEQLKKLGFNVSAKLGSNGLYVDFLLTQVGNFDKEPDIDGSVKWDGCSNWKTQDYYHCCTIQNCLDVGVALALCRSWAKELMGECADFI